MLFSKAYDFQAQKKKVIEYGNIINNFLSECGYKFILDFASDQVYFLKSDGPLKFILSDNEYGMEIMIKFFENGQLLNSPVVNVDFYDIRAVNAPMFRKTFDVYLIQNDNIIDYYLETFRHRIVKNINSFIDYLNTDKEKEDIQKVLPLEGSNQQEMMSIVNKLKQKNQVNKDELIRFFNRYKVEEEK